jgi:hypothetical protein
MATVDPRARPSPLPDQCAHPLGELVGRDILPDRAATGTRGVAPALGPTSAR